MVNPIIIIPARMASTRLPGKPLADIAGQPMIVHVAKAAQRANIGPVLVATDSGAVFAACQKNAIDSVMTADEHPSGSDRICEALAKVDPNAHHDVIVNVQGDLPTINPAIIAKALIPLINDEVDIATLAAEIVDEVEKINPNVVKVIGSRMSEQHLRALYFTRATAPGGNGPLYHHIGLYAYRRSALTRFVSLPPSELEQREKLEQLRALENEMRIDVTIVDEIPFGVDTEEDLQKARQLLEPRRQRHINP